MTTDSAWNKVKALFGGDVRTDVRSPTEYRVTSRGWHVHNGAATGAPCGDGRTLEQACENLLKYLERPASYLAEGSACGWQCHLDYSSMADKQAAARASYKTVIDEACAKVARMPYWKRNLPPCTDSNCEGGYEHEGKHWKPRPTEYDEW